VHHGDNRNVDAYSGGFSASGTCEYRLLYRDADIGHNL
jgi:hypothetical protein